MSRERHSMSNIKKNLRGAIIVVSTVFVLVVCYYCMVLLPNKLAIIHRLENENMTRRKELDHLEEKLQDLPQIRTELIDSLMETRALKNKIPQHQMSITIMMEIIKHINAYDFQDTQVLIGQPIKQEREGDAYNTIPMTLKFTTAYSNATQLLEEISRSDYMVVVDRFTVDNSIQEQRDQEGNRMVKGDIIKGEILLSLQYVNGDDQEAYPNYMAFSNGADNVFLRPSDDWSDN